MTKSTKPLVSRKRIDKGLWWETTWNYQTGCTAISPGCLNCYAARLTATRLKHQKRFKGLAEMKAGRGVFNGGVRVQPFMPSAPSFGLPKIVFVNDMSDTFHESVTHRLLEKTFSVVADPEHSDHLFMFLSKRAANCATYVLCEQDPQQIPNAWLGFSAENQSLFDKRWREMDAVAQAGWNVWVSAEPLLGPVTLPESFLKLGPKAWVVVGGESGPKARPCLVDDVAAIVEQCKGRVRCFVKQLGAKPMVSRGDGPIPMNITSKKGSDLTEWPASCRVRRLPED